MIYLWVERHFMEKLLKRADVLLLKQMYEEEMLVRFEEVTGPSVSAYHNSFDDLLPFLRFYFKDGGMHSVMFVSDAAIVTSNCESLERAISDDARRVPGVKDRMTLASCFAAPVEDMPKYVGYVPSYEPEIPVPLWVSVFVKDGLGRRPPGKSYVDLVARWRLIVGK